MKSKARAAPYPEVVQSGLWLPLSVLLFIKKKTKTKKKKQRYLQRSSFVMISRQPATTSQTT